ncbi:MAG TPA: MXAN_5187 family protein [Myxococcaceae bacterium]|nr:MXAN_5187 family protein [Myxococcaceae bacterium]
MVRLKFAVFAVAVLLLWIWHLYALAPSLSARAVDAASIQAARAPAGLALKIDERRREFHRAALKVASAPAAMAGLRNRAEPPLPEKFGPLRTAALDSIPEPYRAALVVALTNEHGTIYARGSAEAVADAKELNLAALAAAGAEGLWQEAFGAIHLFFSFPVAVFDRGEPKVLGNLVLGAPLLLDGLLDASAKEGGLGAIALLENGKIVSLAGPEKVSIERLDKALQPGKTGVVARSALSSLGPFQFPVGTSGDSFGGKAPLWIGSRQAIRSTPYEVIGLASVRPLMEALAAYQRMALLLFIALLALSSVWLLILEGRDYRIPPRVRDYEPEYERPEREEQQPAYATSSGHAEARPSSLADEPPPVPQAAPEAFQLGQSPRLAGEPSQETAARLADAGATIDGQGAPPAAQSFGAFVEDNQPTMAYPSPLVPGDAFAMASQAGGPDGAANRDEVFNPDATRVAEVPQELLRASARTESNEPPPSRPPPLPQLAPPNDEQHFREVFTAFLSTRQKCGEPADSLTYDRFAQKLRKNRDQLIEKYSCRTVRFHVYVKEGKAALKATPIKD